MIDVDDLVDALNTLWTEADSVFIHEMMRVQVTFLLLLYSDSGARLGAFLENGMAAVKRKDGQKDTLMFEGLTWKVRRYPYGHHSPRPSIWRLTISQDVHVYLFPLPDGSTEVILKLVQCWTKNNKDPDNSVYRIEVPAYEHGKLRHDITAFLLARASEMTCSLELAPRRTFGTSACRRVSHFSNCGCTPRSCTYPC